MCKCDPIFADFEWENLVSLGKEELPPLKGVYAIRIRKRGKPIERLIPRACKFVGAVEWPTFENHVVNRLERLKKITECPVIYIGAAPTSLQSRYMDLCGRRHTAFYAIIALLFVGWELYFRWKEDREPLHRERQLKKKYSSIHANLPAIVRR